MPDHERIEPFYTLGVNWSGGGYYTYSSKGEGKVLSISGFDSTTRIDTGQSSQVTITLSDTDGSLKSIISRTDIHKKPATLYLGFVGDSYGSPILSGVISSPIVWDEGQRTLTFDVVSRLESYEIGFSAEEGNFSAIPMNLLGAGWPLVFGKVPHSPTLQLTKVPTGFIENGMGVPDATLPGEISRMTLAAKNSGDLVGMCLQFAAYACYTLGSSDDCEDDPDVQKWNAEAVRLQEQQQSYQKQASDLQSALASQRQHTGGSGVSASSFVGQGTGGRNGISMRLGDQIFSGSMSYKGNSINGAPLLGGGTFAVFPSDFKGDITRKPQKRGFQWFPGGAGVSLSSRYPIQYVVSLIPGTVSQVFANRNVNGIKSLCVVPPSNYEISSISYGAGAAITIDMKTPLSALNNQTNALSPPVLANSFGGTLVQNAAQIADWEDDVFVTFESSVGPNPVEIMEWIIAKYCPNLSIDAASFGKVKGQLDKYPMHFTYSERTEVVKFLQDLAYQARCVLWIELETFHIKYLSVEEAPVGSITLDDISVGSLQLTTTPTEDIATKYEANWLSDYTTPANKLILRHNVKIYGTRTESFDFFAYSTYAYVEKTATFWLIRKANTWKMLRFKAFITKIGLKALDCVSISLGSMQGIIGSGAVNGIIQRAVFDPSTNLIDFEVWLPVRLGDTSKYDFAWPGSGDGWFFPTQKDMQEGRGGNPINAAAASAFGPELPPGNQVSVSFQKRQANRGGSGDQTEKNWPDPTVPPTIDTMNLTGNPDMMAIGVPTYGGPFPQDSHDEVIDVSIDDRFPIEPEGPPTTKDYDYMDVNDIQLDGPNNVLGVYPCKVVSGEGDEYTVLAYRQGTGGRGTTVDNVKQLQIDKDETIPPGTWGFVVINTSKTGKEATMQIPVWLA